MASKVFEGTVTSTKMAKTLVVSIVRKIRDDVTGKTMTANKKFKVHCEDNSKINVGDRVSFTPCKPFSKEKKFRYLAVMSKAEIADTSSLDEEAVKA
jgi:small subunit ribosomal protein S17